MLFHIRQHRRRGTDGHWIPQTAACAAPNGQLLCPLAAGAADAAETALAATAYRGLLLALPASAALWFGDLRDRGTAAAVESYTRGVHSPMLLAHELAVIQVSQGQLGLGILHDSCN